MHHLKIKEIISRDIGAEAYDEYISFVLSSSKPISDAAKDTLTAVAPGFGSCVMISAGLVAILRAHYSIPAVALLGDLLINDVPVFKCSGNIPMPSYEGEVVNATWDGHCWVEIAGMICDLSVFRSAYAIQGPSLLKGFILENFGIGKGALLSLPEHLPKGMRFSPKYALNDFQISCILSGLSEQSRTGA